jgi:hypothetical protein
MFAGGPVAAADFVTDITGAGHVTAEFSPYFIPDVYKTGWQDIKIILTDGEDNRADISSRLYIFDVMDELTIEAAAVAFLTPWNFIRSHERPGGVYLTGAIDLSAAGSYELTLRSGGSYASVSVNIVDTTPPVASVRNLRIFACRGQTVRASDFVFDIIDASPVSVRFRNAPDFTREGRQDVQIILEDAHGNRTEYGAVLTVIYDRTPPVISGVRDRTVTAGSTVAWRQGVTVTDDYDPNVQLIVNSSGVNLNVPGVYTVIYSATDASGNRSEARASVTVRAVDMDLVNEMADEILAAIITDGMSQLQKARAIYDWVDARMIYSTRNPVRGNIPQGAYNAFTRGSGDCFTYMAASRVLLTRAGIANEIIRRCDSVRGETEHYWNLVDTGAGWHHFDVTPTPRDIITVDRRFMFTQSQAEQFTRDLEDRRPYYFVYDKSTVPEVAP